MAAIPFRLSQALAAVRGVHDFPLLVAALGHEPLWEPLEAAGWAHGGWSRTARVGAAAGFTWYGVEAPDP
ncbi:MAG TPA: hypothetical protein VJ773_03530, partial [Gemmatimonadales bacterium]|nr:hypothetical protein [Gemmatimonadales bacterium]